MLARLWGKVRRWFASDGAEEAKELPSGGGARELEAALRRVLANARVYGLAHPLVEAQFAAFYADLIKRVTTHGDFVLRVEPDRLVPEQADTSAESSVDPMAGLLFADGIASIIFHSTVTEAALKKYVALWHQAGQSAEDPEHSFASLAWEADLPGITTKMRFSFGEFSGTGADELARHYERLMETLRTIAAQRTGGAAAEQRVASFLDGDGDSGARAGGAKAAHPTLAEPELNGLCAAVSASPRGAGQRVLTRLWYEFRATDGGETLLHLAAAIVDGLAHAGRTAELVRAFTRITGSARGDASAEARLGRFLVALGNQKVVSTLVGQLANAEAEPGAVFLLNELPATFAEQIVAALQAAPLELRIKLIPILAKKRVPPAQLAVWMLAVDPPTGEALVAVGAAMSPHHLDAALRVALLADDPGLRRQALKRIDTTTAERYRSLLELNADHGDAGVRHAALELLVAIVDRHAIALFARGALAHDTPPALASACVRALATLGGSEALTALEAAGRRGQPHAVRVQVAQALGQFPDPAAERLLQKTARSWLVDREVRRAARTALKRRQGRRSA